MKVKVTRFLLTPVGGSRRLAVLCGLIMICAAGPVFAEIVDRIVTVVNDDIIRLRELDRAASVFEAQIRGKAYPPEREAEEIYKLRTELLNNLIDEKLADQEIRNSGIFVDDAEVDEAIERIKAANYYSDEDLRTALTGNDVSMNDYREEIRRQILRNKLVNIRIKSKIIITPSDVKAYYEDHADQYAARKQYRLRNIVMDSPVPGDGGEALSPREAMADVHRRLSEGAAFDDLARTCSQAVNAADGGRLGLFALEELAENIATAVRDLKPGEFSEVTETERGFQIFYVETIEESGGVSLEAATDEIRRRLYEEAVNEKFQEWITQLREDAHIKIIR